MKPTFKAIADYAVLVIFATETSDEAHAHVVALDASITSCPPTGMIETVPAIVNLLVTFDPLLTDHAAVQTAIEHTLATLAAHQVSGVQRCVQICYEPPYSTDLDAVAAATGLSAQAVVNAHLAGDYRVLMYGFAPGYAYLSGVPEPVQIPRKPAAVRDVPAGSVIIAGPQCLVTTLTMPTGWSIIGRSSTRVLTGDPAHPFLFDVGDSVTFERIDTATFERLYKENSHG